MTRDTTNRIIIREQIGDDVDALRHLFLRSRETTFYWTDISQFKLSDFDTETRGEHILVAVRDALIVGFIAVWAADNFIHHLHVTPEFQNQQIGTQLLQAVIDTFHLPVKLKCEVNNINAIRFYKKKGFIEKARGMSNGGEYILLELDQSAAHRMSLL